MGQAASTVDQQQPKQKTTLILVDCQKDFHPGGSLAVPTANDDSQRIARLIRNHGLDLDRIVATMDTHLKLHIAHPSFWVKGGGGGEESGQQQHHPEPFTIISAEDVKNGVWKPRPDLVLPCSSLDEMVDPNIFKNRSAFMKTTTSTAADASNVKGKNQPKNASSSSSTPKVAQLDLERYCLEYVTRLEQGKQFQLCIWPEHCLLGSEGHALVPCIQEALHQWSEETGRTVEFVCKGQNILTEMYSAFQAEVPISSDTTLNQRLLDSLVVPPPKDEDSKQQQQEYQVILVCGQTTSHCVNYTVRDLVNYWETTASDSSSDSSAAAAAIPANERPTQIAILTDCASAVPGFEAAAQTFLDDMKAKGVYLIKSTEAFTTDITPSPSMT
ncbi:hypothetical protein ACA910_006805 [Epithemia clementina (nom. ined.)]